MRTRDYITGFLVGTFLGGCMLAVVIVFLHEDAKQHEYPIEPTCVGECVNAVERMKE
jgi:hypothetical protein